MQPPSGDLEEENDERWRNETGNRWWFFLPLVVVGIWLLVTIGSVVADAIAAGSDYDDAGSEEWAEGVRDVLDLVNWFGVVGWLLLFVCYFVILSRKRASAWWALGGFCCGANLLLYIGLLFLPARRHLEAIAPSNLRPSLPDRSIGPVTTFLRDSFVCDACDSLLNYGVSECRKCGARYRYVDGKRCLIDF